jgi:hypothetical protein
MNIIGEAKPHTVSAGFEVRYELIGAYQSGIRKHPAEDMKDRGFIITYYEGVPMADCIIMMLEGDKKNLPDYVVTV